MIFDLTKRKSGEGGGDSKITQIDIVAVTSGAVIDVPVVIPTNYAVSVTIDEIPEADSTLYWGILWATSRIKTPVTAQTSTATSILRPNGTYGTDSTWCNILSNGVRVGGGNYGKCKAGSTYHIIIADIGVTSNA